MELVRKVRNKQLKILCTGEIKIDFHELKDLQILSDGRSLKKTDSSRIDKLAKSLSEYGIVNNLQVWKYGEDMYCFDAHHRKKALMRLESEGVEIPLLPATRCLAKTKKEAKKLLLLKESNASWVDPEAIGDFLTEIDFEFEDAGNFLDFDDCFEGNNEEDIFSESLDAKKRTIKCPNCGHDIEK